MPNARRWRCAVSVAISLLCGSVLAFAQQSGLITSTAKDRVSLAITVYNKNVAFVRELRRVKLPQGRIRLQFESIPNAIRPSAIHFRSADSMPKIAVLDHAYKYDLLTTQRLLQEFVGKKVTLVRHVFRNGVMHSESVQATLLSTYGPVWKIGNEIVSNPKVDGYRFPSLPSGLYSQPVLVWELDNPEAGERTLDMSYLTGGMTWAASYRLLLAPDASSASLEGSASLTNGTGESFVNARIGLIAGDIHLRSPYPGPQTYLPQAGPSVMGGIIGGVAVGEGGGVGGVAIAQQPAGEYHRYSLPNRMSLANNESFNLSLLPTARLPVRRSYVVELKPNAFLYNVQVGEPVSEPVKVYVDFHNDSASGLGLPLPEGTIRIFQSERDGVSMFLGEDNLPSTPNGGQVRLDAGNAFDIAAERRETDFKVLNSGAREMGFEITLRNEKSEPVTVHVRDQLTQNQQLEVLESNYPARKIGPFTLGFDVLVPKGGMVKLNYRVSIRY